MYRHVLKYVYYHINIYIHKKPRIHEFMYWLGFYCHVSSCIAIYGWIALVLYGWLPNTKHLYLGFYSTDFNNLKKNSWLGFYLLYKLLFLFCLLSFRNWEAKKVKIPGFWRHLSTKITSLFLNFDRIETIRCSHFVAKTFLFLTILIDSSFDLDLCIKSWKSYLNILSDHFMSRQVKIQSTKINLKANTNFFLPLIH